MFRKSSTSFGEARFYGILFAGSSLVTPFFLGTVAGAVASGRVPARGYGDPWTSWLNPTSILGGVLAVGTCAWLAAVFLARDADRAGEADLAGWFTLRALATGVAIGAVALGGIGILRADAPALARVLQGRGLVLVVGSAAAGLLAMVLLARRRAEVARVPAVVAVVMIVVGWGVSQYPYLLEGRLTIDQAAAPDPTLWSLVVAFVAAGLLAVPPLVWLLVLSERGSLSGATVPDSSDAELAELHAAPSPGSDDGGDGAGGAGAGTIPEPSP